MKYSYKYVLRILIMMAMLLDSQLNTKDLKILSNKIKDINENDIGEFFEKIVNDLLNNMENSDSNDIMIKNLLSLSSNLDIDEQDLEKIFSSYEKLLDKKIGIDTTDSGKFEDVSEILFQDLVKLSNLIKNNELNQKEVDDKNGLNFNLSEKTININNKTLESILKNKNIINEIKNSKSIKDLIDIAEKNNIKVKNFEFIKKKVSNNIDLKNINSSASNTLFTNDIKSEDVIKIVDNKMQLSNKKLVESIKNDLTHKENTLKSVLSQIMSSKNQNSITLNEKRNKEVFLTNISNLKNIKSKNKHNDINQSKLQGYQKGGEKLKNNIQQIQKEQLLSIEKNITDSNQFKQNNNLNNKINKITDNKKTDNVITLYEEKTTFTNTNFKKITNNKTINQINQNDKKQIILKSSNKKIRKKLENVSESKEIKKIKNFNHINYNEHQKLINIDFNQNSKLINENKKNITISHQVDLKSKNLTIEEEKKIENKELNKEIKNNKIEDFELKTNDNMKLNKIELHKDKKIDIKHTLNTFAQDFKEQVKSYKPPLMRVKMQLNPKGLGEVDVTMINRGNNLHITVNSNPNTIAIFSQNQTEFKNSLVNMGFSELSMNFNENGKNKDNNQNQKNKRGSFENFKDESHQDSFEMITPIYI